jgi:predicted glycosyltransferase
VDQYIRKIIEEPEKKSSVKVSKPDMRIRNMDKISVLFISGSLGLGHITRDIAIANQLRILLPEVDIEWLAAFPATTF